MPAMRRPTSWIAAASASSPVACRRSTIAPRYFTDYLVLLKTTEGWKIVSKVFRADIRD